MKRADTEDGLYQIGNPVLGTKGTRTAEFYNDVQEEICNVIEAAGIVLDGERRDQLLEALTTRNLIPAWSDVFTLDESVALTAYGVIYLGDTTVGALEWIAPTAIGKKGRQIYFENIGQSGNILTLNGIGAETVEGASGLDLDDGMGRTIYSDGANWRILKG
jgi:hypothetical protein